MFHVMQVPFPIGDRRGIQNIKNSGLCRHGLYTQYMGTVRVSYLLLVTSVATGSDAIYCYTYSSRVSIKLVLLRQQTEL